VGDAVICIRVALAETSSFHIDNVHLNPIARYYLWSQSYQSYNIHIDPIGLIRIVLCRTLSGFLSRLDRASPRNVAIDDDPADMSALAS
jgi:hypothetical protein